MGDFVQNNNVKSAVRALAEPIADVAAFDALVQAVITTNPFACVAYSSGSESHQPVEKSKEAYVAKIVFIGRRRKETRNRVSIASTPFRLHRRYPVINAVAALNTAHNRTPAHDVAKDTFSATLKCHDPNGEIYMVTFSRDSVHITSYSDDGILTKVEAWADSVPALA